MGATVERMSRLAEKRYLGPAEVRAAGRNRCDVLLPSGVAQEATLALAYPYEPTVGDTLLVIGDEEGLYAIGLIEGRGKLRLSFPGDVEVRAVDGHLTLSGDRGVSLRGPSLDVLADRFSVLADRAVQKFG